jgi:hypothetical protein
MLNPCQARRPSWSDKTLVSPVLSGFPTPMTGLLFADQFEIGISLNPFKVEAATDLPTRPGHLLRRQGSSTCSNMLTTSFALEIW